MPLRVLHCPSVVGGNPVGVARAERELGLASRVVNMAEDPFGYEVDETLWRPDDGPLRREVQRWRLLRRALRDFDVVHFNFGSSLSPPRLEEHARGYGVRRLLGYPYDAYAALLFQRDLPLLRRAGKVIAVTYQGSDARQRDVTLAHLEPEIVDVLPPDFFPPESDELKRRSIAGFDRYADLIYSVNPDLLRMLPARTRFVPYAHIDPSTYEVKLPDPDRPPVVAHAPSHQGRKGTTFLVQAVEKLRAEGIEIDFRLIENVPHSELQRIWYEADVVIDQLLIGWYGGTAVEAMAHGKPVVARLSAADLDLIPAEMRDDMPIVNAGPGTIENALRDLLGPRRRELAALGERSRRYAETWHDPRRIAAGLRDDYERVRTGPGFTLSA